MKGSRTTAVPEPRPSRVSEVVWPWREAGRDAARKAGPGPRVRSLVQAMILGAAGLVLILVLGQTLPGEIVLAVAGAVLVSGIFIPPVYRWFALLGGLLGRAAAFLLARALLAPFFLLCFVPARFVLVLLGRDPLRRAFPGREKSYWVPHPPPRDAARFKRQY